MNEVTLEYMILDEQIEYANLDIDHRSCASYASVVAARIEAHHDYDQDTSMERWAVY
jgi:hypothetical protein